jgi:hypothetical protein
LPTGYLFLREQLSDDELAVLGRETMQTLIVGRDITA